MDLDTYLTTNILDTFAETPGIGYHHVDVVGVIGASVTTPGMGVGQCVTTFMIVLGLKSVEGPSGLFAFS